MCQIEEQENICAVATRKMLGASRSSGLVTAGKGNRSNEMRPINRRKETECEWMLIVLWRGEVNQLGPVFRPSQCESNRLTRYATQVHS